MPTQPDTTIEKLEDALKETITILRLVIRDISVNGTIEERARTFYVERLDKALNLLNQEGSTEEEGHEQ